jgi:hypothetical protein
MGLILTPLVLRVCEVGTGLRGSKKVTTAFAKKITHETTRNEQQSQILFIPCSRNHVLTTVDPDCFDKLDEKT